MKRDVPVHYLRANEKEWTPPCVVTLDAETRYAREGDREVHTIRLWCARLDDRRPQRGKRIEHLRDRGYSGEDFALTLDAWCRGRRTVWLYAHNLHFDLSTTDLVRNMMHCGWEVTDFALDGYSPWVRMCKGNHNLTVSDSYSWLPVKLETVAAAVGEFKVPLPGNNDSNEAWFARCDQDVDILATAVLELMKWWDSEHLGRWTITGGASGWNCMRHIPAMRKVLIDVEPGKVSFDRQAVYGGRRSVWRAGKMPAGRYVEADFERAYTVICRDCPLPLERMARFDFLPLDHKWLECKRLGVVARVVIETGTPRWPVRHGRRVWYPVGRFETVLAGPDIKAALDAGCLREVKEGWVHKLGYALRPWAAWCLESQEDDTGRTPQVAKITLKHWGRTTVGKWAQRGFERIRLGASPTRDWGYQEAWNHTEDVKASIVDFGGWRWQVSASGQSDNAYPAILAFVEAYVRQGLGAAIETIGEAQMICADTDGMIIDAVRAVRARYAYPSGQPVSVPRGRKLEAVLGLASNAAAPLRLREKRSFRDVEVIGPQHLMMDGGRRLAGVPSSAERTGDGRFEGWLWPKLAWQMRHGRAGAFTRPRQLYRLAASYAPGWVLSTGCVVPVEAAIGGDGATRLLPWEQTRWCRRGDTLADGQPKEVIRCAQGPRNARDRPHQPGAAAAPGAKRKSRAG